MKRLPLKGVRTAIIVCVAFLIAIAVAEAQTVKSQVRVLPGSRELGAMPPAADTASMVKANADAIPRLPPQKIKMIDNPNFRVVKDVGNVQKIDKDISKLKNMAEGMQILSGSIITPEQKQEVITWMNSVSIGFSKAADYLDVAFPQDELYPGSQSYGTNFAYLIVLVTPYSNPWWAKEDTVTKLQYIRQFFSKMRAILESVSQVNTVKYPKCEGCPNDPKEAWLHLIDVYDEYADACLWFVIADFVRAQNIVKDSKTNNYIETGPMSDEWRQVGKDFSDFYAPEFAE
ncbi:MAG: hypothetical protein WC690_04570 [bacterium]